jgi:hypothetical protein
MRSLLPFGSRLDSWSVRPTAHRDEHDCWRVSLGAARRPAILLPRPSVPAAANLAYGNFYADAGVDLALHYW